MDDYFRGFAEKYHREFGGDRKYAHWVQTVALFAMMDLQAELIGASSNGDETAWLIEFSQRVSVQPCWYGKTEDGLGQTTDPNAALRFARAEDAQMVIEDFGWTDARPSEHMWCAPRSTVTA